MHACMYACMHAYMRTCRQTETDRETDRQQERIQEFLKGGFRNFQTDKQNPRGGRGTSWVPEKVRPWEFSK